MPHVIPTFSSRFKKSIRILERSDITIATIIKNILSNPDIPLDDIIKLILEKEIKNEIDLALAFKKLCNRY